MEDTVRILLVDDPDFADLAATSLEREDDRFAVETTTDAGGAIDRLTESAVDCIVSDYDLPGRNGIEFLEAVRSDRPDLPFILFTGKGSEKIASDAISAGITDYLQKESSADQYTALASRIDDAVEQHHARRAVRTAEQKLSQLSEHTDDVFFMFDADWTELLFVNSAYEEVWGGSITALRENPQSFLERIHHRDREQVRRSMDRVSNGNADEIEYRILRPDGERRWIRAETRPVFDDADTVSRIVGFARDITDRKRRERELKRAREEYEELINGMNDTAWVIDTDSTFLAVNDAAVETMGYSREELLSMTPHAIDGDLDDDKITELVQEMPEDEIQVFETVHETKEGERIPVEISSSLVSYQGETAILSIGRDISNRKEREERLEQFASIVSHDLRNPLTVAQGRLELAREECESDHLDEISWAHDRMSVLINNLLALASEGEGKRNVEVVDLGDVVQNSWNHVATGEATLADDLDQTIHADRSRLQQLLENLMRNAVEHGGTDVTVAVGGLDDGFYIEDDGSGISESDRENMFKSGYSTAKGGTGLGLSIVKQVVDAHGWDISVTASSDGGTRFEITDVAHG